MTPLDFLQLNQEERERERERWMDRRRVGGGRKRRELHISALHVETNSKVEAASPLILRDEEA